MSPLECLLPSNKSPFRNDVILIYPELSSFVSIKEYRRFLGEAGLAFILKPENVEKKFPIHAGTWQITYANVRRAPLVS